MAVATRTSSLCCIQIQRSFDEQLPNIAPSNFPYDGNLLMALKSPENVGNFNLSDPRHFGKGRPQVGNDCVVEVTYELPFCDDAETTCLDVCDTQTVRGDSMAYLGVTVDYFRSYAGQFTDYDFQCLCEAPNERLTKRIDQAAQIITKSMVEHLAALMYAQVGSYSNGLASNDVANYESLPLLNPAGYSNPAGMTKVVNEHRLQRGRSNPFIVGGLALENWMRVRTVGGLNGQHPIQPGDQSFGANIVTDLDVDQALKDIAGDNLDHAISWQPGAFQLLEWYENEGYMERFHDHYTFTTITIRGVKFDFYIRYEECTRTWKWVLCKAYDLFSLGEALYAPCIIGNHKLHWTLDCAQFACEDYYVAPAVASS
jgi:hypothetical protein